MRLLALLLLSCAVITTSPATAEVKADSAVKLAEPAQPVIWSKPRLARERGAGSPTTRENYIPISPLPAALRPTRPPAGSPL